MVLVIQLRVFQSFAQEIVTNADEHAALDAENEYDIIGKDNVMESSIDKNYVQNDTSSDHKESESNDNSETREINDQFEAPGAELAPKEEQENNIEKDGVDVPTEKRNLTGVIPDAEAAPEGGILYGDLETGDGIERGNGINITKEQEISSLPAAKEEEEELGASAEEHGSGSRIEGDSHPPLNRGEHPAQNNTELDMHKQNKNKTIETDNNIEEVVDNNADPEERYEGCSHCEPGYGVITVCNATHDTVCAACPPGTFSAVYSAQLPCQPCGVCSEGYYQRTPCVPMQDVNCVLCFNGGGGFGNEDFLRKCETTTTTVTHPTTTTTTQQTGSTTVELNAVEIEEKTRKTTRKNKNRPKTTVTAKSPTTRTGTCIYIILHQQSFFLFSVHMLVPIRTW